MVPHAGYVFSAYHAIHFFEIVKQSEEHFESVFIINPNHTGYGEAIAFDSNEAWSTPLGTTPVDMDFVETMKFAKSAAAHQYEHSGEVMLPFLQYMLDYEFKIVPVTLSVQNVEVAEQLAKSIYNANEKLNKKILIIASSDFSHYVSPEEGKEMDDYVVKEILEQNTRNVYNQVRTKNISVCGYGPIMTLMEYAKLVSRQPQVDILHRGHSGEIMPSNEVVDYISILFSNQ